MAHGLLSKILEYGFEQGWWEEGWTILDPFGGIGSTGLLCSYRGLRSVSVELETKFYRLAVGYDCPGEGDVCPACEADNGEQWLWEKKAPHHFEGNFERHRRAWASQGLPLPVMVQGDSRKLPEVLADAVVSSPPYAESGKELNCTGHSRQVPYNDATERHIPAYGTTPGQIGRMKSGSVEAVVSSPPFMNQSPSHDKPENYKGFQHVGSIRVGATGYGYNEDNPNNIGNMKSGTVDGVVKKNNNILDNNHHDGIVTSWQRTGQNVSGEKIGNSQGKSPLSEISTSASIAEPPKTSMSTTSKQPDRREEHGITIPTTLPPSVSNATPNGMPIEDPQGPTCVDSAAIHSGPEDEKRSSVGRMRADESISGKPATHLTNGNTSASVNGAASISPEAKEDDSIVQPNVIAKLRTSKNGKDKEPDDYWHAVAQVYKGCWQVLKPGGILVLVCKDYIKSGKRVPLCDDTMKLLVSLGFVPVARIRAMLKKEWTEQTFGGEVTQEKSRKSFFRRLCEKKGSPPIDYEEVLVVRAGQMALFK